MSAVPGPVSSTARWQAVLGELEMLVQRQARAIDEGGPVDADALGRLMFEVPAGLPPVPAGMADRLRRVLDATTDLVERARQRSGSPPPPIPVVRARRRTAPATLDRLV